MRTNEIPSKRHGCQKIVTQQKGDRGNQPA